MSMKQLVKLFYLRRKYKKCKLESTSISADIILEDGVIIHKNTYIGHGCVMGAYSYVNPNTFIDDYTEIGKFCSISRNVMIGLGNHKMDGITTHPIGYSKEWNEYIKTDMVKNKKTIIENDVWIGAGAIILNGIHIGNGAVVAAGAVVTKDVDEYTVVAGVPSRVIKKRDITIDSSTKEWWNLSIIELKKLLASKNA